MPCASLLTLSLTQTSVALGVNGPSASLLATQNNAIEAQPLLGVTTSNDVGGYSFASLYTASIKNVGLISLKVLLTSNVSSQVNLNSRPRPIAFHPRIRLCYPFVVPSGGEEERSKGRGPRPR